MALKSKRALLSMVPVALVALLSGCESYSFLSDGSAVGGTSVGLFFSGDAFNEVVIQGRTYVDGSSVASVTYDTADMKRTPIGVDFNADGKIDPVVGYSVGSSGVVQILLSKGQTGQVNFSNLSLDGNGRWIKLSDVAVGDMDGDGAPDILAAAQDGIVYLHNPGPGQATTLRDWGSVNPDAEFLSGSTTTLTNDEVEAILSDVLPPGTDLNNYDITVEQGYTNVEIGDMDNDGSNDVIASRRLKINLAPKQNANVPPVQVISGELQVFINPGRATDGLNWQLNTVGVHERFAELDRNGAAAIVPFDLDGDGDLDLISSARDDANTQIAWFENPGRLLINDLPSWVQWRVGSLRDSQSIDIADVTGDGRVDVIAAGGQQLQVYLFEQPAEGPRREYDWDGYPVVTFASIVPSDVKALDVDNDGQLELVVAGSEGAVRYFKPADDPRQAWESAVAVDFDDKGNVGFLGFGDLDADGDLDLIAVLNDQQDQNNDRVTWLKNNLGR